MIHSKMGKEVLAPDRLKADPNLPTSEKEYKHWRKTFEFFLEEAVPPLNPAAGTTSSSTGPTVTTDDIDHFKLRCLTKYVSYSIYEYFADCESYTESITILDQLFIKRRNEIFQRHLLAKRQ